MKTKTVTKTHSKTEYKTDYKTDLKTTTRFYTKTDYQTHYDTKTVSQLTYVTRPVTIRSEIMIPETTIIKTHTRTIHDDHYFTITPPTRTVYKTITETSHKTTMTLPIQTEIITHHLPPAERHVMMKFIGNTSILLVLVWFLFFYLQRRRKTIAKERRLHQL